MLQLVMTDIGFLREKSVFERQLAQVHPARREHILRFRLEGDRCRSLAAGLLLRKIFVQLGLDYDRLEVEVESSGKPGIKEWKYRDHNQEYAKISRWYYSVTHSEDYAAAAVADVPIGIDLEAIHRFRNKKSLERRFLTGKEKLLLEKILEEHDAEEYAREAFLARVWTRKEAYAKADGRGLGIDFRRIDTTLEERFWSKQLLEDYWLSAYIPEEKVWYDFREHGKIEWEADWNA